MANAKVNRRRSAKRGTNTGHENAEGMASVSAPALNRQLEIFCKMIYLFCKPWE